MPQPEPLNRLTRRFFARDAEAVARALIGAVLVRERDGKIFRGRIVETEAYIGTHDLASHASKGRTARTDVMFGPPGHAYVYFIYGVHEMFNIVTSNEGDAQAVLVRAAEPLDGWDVSLTGPGKLARGFGITRGESRLDLVTSEALYLTRGTGRRPRVKATPRVGVDYAGDWRDKPLRFIDQDSPAVSGRKVLKPLGSPRVTRTRTRKSPPPG
jgi:DNA-3-methyladenine glycosylase